MRTRRRLTALLGVLALAAACGGGSGSTGLIDSEGATIDHVRQTGTCAESGGADFCATNSPNATAPGGQRASVILTTPTPVPTPTAVSTGGEFTPTPPATPAATASSGPVPTESPTPVPTVRVLVEGFGPDAACAVASRLDGSNDPWRTAPLADLAEAGPTTFQLTSPVPEPAELVLLCFAPAPANLPFELTSLADADPTVVFVLPDE